MGSGQSTPQQRVVIIGAGFGGRYLAKALDGVAHVTVIASEPFAFHNIAALRAAARGGDYARTLVAPLHKLLAHGSVVYGHASGLTDSTVTVTASDGSTSLVEFDFAVIATGSSYAAPCKAPAPTAAGTIAYFDKLAARIGRAASVLVVGGGPVGLELAGELAETHGTKLTVTLAHRSARLLSGKWTGNATGQVAENASAYALTKLQAHGVTVLLNSPVQRPGTGTAAAEAAAGQDAATAAPEGVVAESTAEGEGEGEGKEGGADGAGAGDEKEGEGKEAAPPSGDAAEAAEAAPVAGAAAPAPEEVSELGEGVWAPEGGVVRLADGREVAADLAFWCTGGRPNSAWFAAEHGDKVDEHGFIKVDASLRVPGLPHVFAMGDVADTGDAKLAYATKGQTDSVLMPNLRKLSAAKAAGTPLEAVTDLATLAVGAPVAMVTFGSRDGIVNFGGTAMCDCLVVNMKSGNLFAGDFATTLGGTAADTNDWAAEGAPQWDLAPGTGVAKGCCA